MEYEKSMAAYCVKLAAQRDVRSYAKDKFSLNRASLFSKLCAYRTSYFAAAPRMQIVDIGPGWVYVKRQ
jgi:hypothetical protein